MQYCMCIQLLRYEDGDTTGERFGNVAHQTELL